MCELIVRFIKSFKDQKSFITQMILNCLSLGDRESFEVHYLSMTLYKYSIYDKSITKNFKKMIDLCLQKAKEFGFKKCYLETMVFMKAAHRLYEKTGFYYIDAPLDNTGHTSCPIWMMKDL